MTLVYYFVPEDGESDTSLNAFAINQPISQITELDIHNNFPLKGTYKFNYRIKYNRQFIYIIQDNQGSESELQKPVPNAENKIVIKANRISWMGKEGIDQDDQKYLY